MNMEINGINEIIHTSGPVTVTLYHQGKRNNRDMLVLTSAIIEVPHSAQLHYTELLDVMDEAVELANAVAPFRHYASRSISGNLVYIIN